MKWSELPKKEHITFRTRRKLENKKSKVSSALIKHNPIHECVCVCGDRAPHIVNVDNKDGQLCGHVHVQAYCILMWNAFFKGGGGGVSEGNHRVDDTRVEIGSAFFADFVTGGVYIFGGN